MTRYEAVYDDDEEDRRGGWRLVEWTHYNPANGARQGRTVEHYYGSEDACREAAAILQAAFERELYAELG